MDNVNKDCSLQSPPGPPPLFGAQFTHLLTNECQNYRQYEREEWRCRIKVDISRF